MGKYHQKHRTLFVKQDLKTLNCSFDIKKAFYLFMKNFNVCSTETGMKISLQLPKNDYQ
jgi:hypothetical protein